MKKWLIKSLTHLLNVGGFTSPLVLGHSSLVALLLDLEVQLILTVFAGFHVFYR